MPSDASQTMPLGDDADLIAIAREYEAQCEAQVGTRDNPPAFAEWLDRVAPGQRAVLLRRLVAVAADRLTGRGVEDPTEPLVAANPGFADDLRRLLASRDAPTTGHDTGSSTGMLRVRCPHCRNPIEVVADADLDSVACPSCGSSFGLADDPPTRVAEPARSVAHFDLIERVGAGAFGEVWKAHDTKLDRTVAVKIPRRGLLDSVQQKLFLREAQNAAQLNHPRIVPVHEVGRDGDTLYLVSDFVRGLTLADWLSGQSPTTREAAELTRQIAEALEHAHERGVVHRDLKPGNVMLDGLDTGAGECRLMDFGLARRDAAAITMTRDGQVLGTPAYMSPEQARGDAHAADRRSDVYSLGVILFELLTGERPFRGAERMLLHQVIHDEPPSPRKLNAAVPRDLETITLKCLDKDPDRRYATAGEVERELDRWLGGHAIEARPIPTTLRAIRWCRRNPWPAAYSATLAGVLVAGTLLYGAKLQQDATLLSEKLSTEVELRKRITQENAAAVSEAKAAEEARLKAVTATEAAQKAELKAERASAALAQQLANTELARRDAEWMTDFCLSIIEIPGQIDERKQVDPMELLVAWSYRSTERIKERLASSPKRGWELINPMSRSMYAIENYDRAVSLAEEGVVLATAGWGPLSPQSLLSSRELLRAKMRRRERSPEYSDLLEELEELAETTRQELGSRDLIYIVVATDAALGNFLVGRREEALEWADGTIDSFLQLRTENVLHQEAAFRLGMVYCSYERYADAVKPFEVFARLSRELDGLESATTLQALHANLAWALTGAGLHDRAIEVQQEAVGLFQSKYPNEPHQWLWPAGHLVYRNLRGDRVAAAQQAAEEFLGFAADAKLQHPPREIWTIWMLYHRLLADGDGEAASRLRRLVANTSPFVPGDEAPLLRSELNYLDRQGRPAPGESWSAAIRHRLAAIQDRFIEIDGAANDTARAAALLAEASPPGDSPAE